MSESSWKRHSAEQAKAEFNVPTPSREDGAPVYVFERDDYLAWTYRSQPTFLFAHGRAFVYWIRRVADQLEWVGDSELLADAKDAAEQRLERIISTGRG